MSKKKIGIIGATGYTGSELVRLLVHHPFVEIVIITSESRKGEKFSDVHPQFLGICDQELESIENLEHHELDIVFLALPHGVSMDFVVKHHNKDFTIIDLSGDFRLSTPEVYEEWYQKTHVFADGFANAVYGLPELYRDRISAGKIIANPGCFPTASILPIAPLVIESLVEKNIIVDAKTGVTGAGIKAKPVTHFPNANDNFTAYGVTTHRHSIEIQEKVSEHYFDKAEVLFTPHLLPVDRGILSTTYMKPKGDITQAQIDEVYQKHYGNEPFIKVVDKLPNLKEVRGTNDCRIYVKLDTRTNTIIAIGVIDNLVKGAAGQAIQNMNIVLGIDETTGLNIVPLQP